MSTGAFIDGVRMLWEISIQTTFPDSLTRLGDKHTNGSIHASSMFNGDDGTIEAWFRLNIVDPQPWVCPHPDDAFPSVSRRFQDYIPDIERYRLKVWDIQNNHNSTGYLSIRDNVGQSILLSGRADFLLTDSRETTASFMFRTLVIIEIQSKPSEDNCDRQMIAYMFLMMNTKALPSVYGFVVYSDGRCRAFKASRDAGGNCVYEQNDCFYICHLATVIGDLLQRVPAAPTQG